MTGLLGLFASSNVNCLDSAQACQTGLPTVAADNNAVQTVLQITFGIIGALAIIYIIIGALHFITAQGNPQEAAKARQTIIYSVIGLIVALSAEAIVTFALSKV